MPLTKDQKEGLRKIYSEMGRIGARARTLSMTPEERSAQAFRAALTRWENAKKREAARKRVSK